MFMSGKGDIQVRNLCASRPPKGLWISGCQFPCGGCLGCVVRLGLLLLGGFDAFLLCFLCVCVAVRLRSAFLCPFVTLRSLLACLPSVRPSARPSVRPSVSQSVRVRPSASVRPLVAEVWFCACYHLCTAHVAAVHRFAKMREVPSWTRVSVCLICCACCSGSSGIVLFTIQMFAPVERRCSLRVPNITLSSPLGMRSRAQLHRSDATEGRVQSV